MKKLMRLTDLSFLFVAAALVLAGCVKKDEFYDKNTDEPNRKQQVKIFGAENDINLYALNTLPATETFALIEIARSPNSEAQGNTPLTVKLVKSSSLITAYNAANGTNYIEVPLSAYTLSDDINNVTFAPGESIKQVKITLKKDQLDLSKQYALGYTLTDAGSGAIITAGLDKVLYAIGLKNAYDGVYSYVSGYVQRYTAPGVPATDALSGPLGPQNPDIELVTTGATSVAFTGAGGPVGLTWSGPMSGVAGIGGLSANIDPATNIPTFSAQEAPGGLTLTNWAGHVNKYDPATKTLTMAIRWNPTANVREYEVVLKYKGPR